MFGHDFPYLDTRDLNLDWLLKNMKTLVQDWTTYQLSMNQQFSTLTEAFNALKAWVESYFENLDVSAEIEQKLDRMAVSGELGFIMRPIVAGEVSDWLAEHITNPSNPPIDTSLTIANAAADAKETGIQIGLVASDLIKTAEIYYYKVLRKSDYTYKQGLRPNADGSWTVYANGTYSSILVPCKQFDHFYQTNPRNNTGFVLDSDQKVLTTANFSHDTPYIVKNANAAYMSFSVKTDDDQSILWYTNIPYADLPSVSAANFGKLFYVFGDNVKEYAKMFNNFDLQNNVVVDSSDYNRLTSNLPRNTYSHIAVADFDDLPTLDSNENNVIIITFSSFGGHELLTGVRTQFLISPIFGRLFTRRTVNGTFTNWTDIEKTYNNFNLQNNVVTDSSIYNRLTANLPRNTYSHIVVADFDDLPVLDSNENNVIIITFSSFGGHESLTGVRTQLLISPIFGRLFTRRTVGGTYTDWTSSYFETMPRYVAFGDSLTYGAIWTEDENQQPVISRTAWKYRFPARIAHAIGADFTFENDGVGGMAFVPHTGTYATSFYDYISAQDLTDVDIVTIGGGRNDAPTPLGTAADPQEGTICYEVDRILAYLTSTYKQMQIVWYQVTPSTSDNSQVFTRVTDGGWSLNSFEEQVSAVCAKYCVPFINWKGCTYMAHWADYTGAGGNTAHPNNDNSYKQMGNYLAGKVAAIYKG